MSAVGQLLGQLDENELRELAERLQPYLAADDGWLGTREAARYAGSSVHALRHAMAAGAVEFEQHCPRGKTWFRRSALDRWRSAHTT